ncbi:MAG: anthranilate synthase component I [Micrococcales bacterium]|nr:anthranilate synthase component I [Micrococcales bacterium]
MTRTFNLAKADFTRIAKPGLVVPIFLNISVGNESPVDIYEKVSENRQGTFLLESAEQGVWSQFSFIGVSSRASFIQSDTELMVSRPDFALPNGSKLPIDAFEAIKLVQSSWTILEQPNLPPLTSGLVGLFSWDVIRQIEHLPIVPMKDYEHPNIHLEMVQEIIVMDHKTNRLMLVSNIYCDHNLDNEAAYDLAIQRIAELLELLAEPMKLVSAVSGNDEPALLSHRTPKDDFMTAIAKAKEYVRIGDVFQVVISQRFDVEVKVRPIDVYRALRQLNPSPYMYLLNYEDKNGPYSVVGSSPEALVKVTGTEVVMHPIAGSRPRSMNHAEDEALAQSLLADAKERAEHLMLVDLARNDLLKVCEPSSVTVTQFMKIERFSHIMHLVSTVEGSLRADKSAIDVFTATFPAGTLSGAPKPRALEIIDELEPANRGIFGGVVGYFDFAGNADLAISIRTAFIREGIARVQAGAGIVLDSVPESEYQETVNKTGAVIEAISQANSLFGAE